MADVAFLDVLGVVFGPLIGAVASAILFGIFRRLKTWQTELRHNRAAIREVQHTLSILVVILKEKVPSFQTEWSKYSQILENARNQTKTEEAGSS